MSDRKRITDLLKEDTHNFQQTKLLLSVLGGGLIFDEDAEDRYYYGNVKVFLTRGGGLVPLGDFYKTPIYHGFVQALERVTLNHGYTDERSKREIERGYDIGTAIVVGFSEGMSRARRSLGYLGEQLKIETPE